MAYEARTWVAGENADETKLNTIRDSLIFFRGLRRYYQFRVTGASTAVSTGDGKEHIHIVSDFNGMNLVEIHGLMDAAGTTGLFTVSVYNVTDSVHMLSTSLTIDSGEVGSDTAATPAVIDTAHDDVATNDILRIDYDTVHTTPGQGFIITLGFAYP